MKKKDFLLLNVALFTAIGASSAEEILVDNTLSIDDVVVTATGTPRLLKETPEAIQVFSATDIERTSAVTLDGALEKLSSSFTVHTNGMGTSVNLNGVEDDYFIYLENGRKINGDNVFSRIDLSRVKRIEIMSGAAATLYGSNAIGGVINIITYDDSDPTGVNATSTTSYNGYGRLTQSVNVDVKSKKLTSQTSYRFQKSDSWQLSDQSLSTKGVYSETTDDAFDGYSNNLLNQHFYYNVNDKLELSAYGSYYDNLSDRTYDYHKYNLHHESYGYGAGAKYKISDNSMLVADFTSDNYTSSYIYFKDSGDFEYGDEDLKNRTYYHNADVKGIFQLGKMNRLTAGAEYTLNTLYDPDDYLIYSKIYTTELYAQDELSLFENLQATVGVRYTYNKLFKSNVTQNASLLYNLGKFSFRATYATGYLIPSQGDLYASTYTSTKETLTRNNEDLDPEKSVYFSFGTEFTNRWLSLSASIFHNKINDMIAYKSLDLSEATAEELAAYPDMEELNEKYNTRAEVLGVNASAKIYFGAGLSLKANYTYLDSFDFDNRSPIDKSVEHTAVINANWGKQWNNYRLNISIDGQYNSSMYSAFYSGVQGEIPDYTLWDITTSHSFKLNNGVVIEPTIGIQNIFDYTDDRPINSYYATLTPGRSLYLSLTLRF
ncbi:MAG: TonB-dependent receptor [Rikenellaceae bacterium]